MRIRPFPFHAMLVAFAVALPTGLHAQNVEVRAYLTPGSTVVGRSFVLNVEITGAQRLDRDLDVPDLGPFARYLGSGTSSSMQIENGRSSVTLTVQYQFQALEEGTFRIPAVPVRVGGDTHSTEVLELTVSAAPQAGGGGGGSSQPSGGEAGGAEVAPEDLFVTAEASRTSVREGEPFVVEYRIWTRVDVGSYRLTSLPELQGFWSEELDQPRSPDVEQVTRNGSNYATAVIRRIALVPTGSGTRTLDPLGIEADVRVRRAVPFDRLFGGGSLFGSTSVTATALSNPLTVEVEPLPPGRPEPFSGVVGSLDLTASVDRDSVGVNDAVTLTVRVSGEGNVGAVPAPRMDLPPDFEVFPPEVSDDVRPTASGLGGTKTFEFVLIPRAPGDREVPPISMSYFDPDDGAYHMASTPALPLTVTGTAVAVGAPGTRGGVAELREDIRFIHLGATGLRPADRVLFGRPGFWMFMLLPMAGVAGALALRRHRDRLVADIAWARGRRAGRVARKRLAEARRLSDGDDARAFYAEVARALRGFAADKLNLSEAGLQTTDLHEALGRAGIVDDTAGELAACLEHCDRQRFAPPAPDPGEKERFLGRAGALMTALDREIDR